jgi:hypothetical protein
MMREHKVGAVVRAAPADGVLGSSASNPPGHERTTPRISAAGASLQGGAALIAFSTESPHASRGDVHLADMVRALRRRGIPSRLFHAHLDPTDNEENLRRIERLVGRLIEEGIRWAIFSELWTPELGRQLHAAGIGVIETRRHTFASAVFTELTESELLKYVGECSTGAVLDELADLVEIVGPRTIRPVTAIDLRMHQACGYKRSLADNPFYRDVTDVPEVAAHRGCAYCLNATTDTVSTPEQTAQRIVERIRGDRQVFPALETFWVAFAETYYDALAIAFRTWRGDPVWHGITLAMQCRPDVIARRANEIEALAADAAASGTRLRIGVVGFENFSPPEIDVLNRGAAPESLDAAAEILNRWVTHPPIGLVARDFTPSFILFTPWTQIEDLEMNLERIARHGLWNANIERLRIGPGTPAFAKAQRDGLVADGPVRAAAHPNGYSSEREIRFADARVAAVATGFDQLRSLAPNDQPELLGGIITAVLAAREPALVEWDGIARAWKDMDGAARAS